MVFLSEKTGYEEMFTRTTEHIKRGVGTEYSCAAAAVLQGDRVLLRFCTGNRQDFSGTEFEHRDERPVDFDTLYDMASVSKLVSTTQVALRLLEDGYFSLFDTVGRFYEDAGNFGGVTIRDLMTHSSGLTPHIALYRKCPSPDAAIRTILDSEPLNPPGGQVHYSCMGYILLKDILEKITGSTLDVLARELVFGPLGMKSACYKPSSENTAATEYSPLGHYYICGHVHDENAHYLGGVSGNAGVFASLDDMIRFGMMLSGRGSLNGTRFLNRRTFDAAVHNYTPGLNECRGLGFSLREYDLSASGDLTTPGSYGHNGYTGTSVYCDNETGICMILLTNSVHYGRDNRGPFFRDRRIFHNIALTEADRALKIR